jgi:hypothetical protein
VHSARRDLQAVLSLSGVAVPRRLNSHHVLTFAPSRGNPLFYFVSRMIKTWQQAR